MKKLIYILLLLPIISFAQKKKVKDVKKDSIKEFERFKELVYKPRYYNINPCFCVIELSKKMNTRKKMTFNPYVWEDKDSLKPIKIDYDIY